MADYILREAAIAAIKKDIMGGLNYERILNSIPAADVQPVKHGRWIKRDCHFDFECKCSVCGYKDFILTKQDRYWFNRNYCPNCGADMRETNDEKA